MKNNKSIYNTSLSVNVEYNVAIFNQLFELVK